MQIRSVGGTTRVSERVVGMNWVVGRVDQDYWRHKGVVFMEPDGDWYGRSAIGDTELTGCVKKVHDCAIVVDERVEGRGESRVVM